MIESLARGYESYSGCCRGETLRSKVVGRDVAWGQVREASPKGGSLLGVQQIEEILQANTKKNPIDTHSGTPIDKVIIYKRFVSINKFKYLFESIYTCVQL